jgi:hypothetical protein
MANPLIATNLLQLFTIIAKGHVLAHQINLGYNSQKLFQRDIALANNPNRNHVLHLVNLVLQLDIILFLVERPLALVELLVEGGH